MQDLKSIPPEIWLTILQHLCLAKRCKLATVSKAWGERGGLIDMSITALSYEESCRMQGFISAYSQPNNTPKKDVFSHLSCLTAFDGYFRDNESITQINRCSRSLRSLRLRSGILNSILAYPIEELTNLTTLRVDGCQTVEREVLLSMRHLTSLDIDSPLSLSGELLERLAPQLKALVVRDEMIVTDSAIMMLTALKSLSIHNSYQITAASVSTLTQLDHLSLLYDDDEISNQIGIASLAFYSLTNLCSLKLSGYHSALGSDLIHISSLRSLHLSEYNDETTSTILWHLSQLTRLVLVGECYEPLDQHLLRMTDLQELKLGGKFSQIREHTLARMTRLTSLSLDGISIEGAVCFSSLTNMKVLELGRLIARSVDYFTLPISLTTLKVNRNQKRNGTIRVLDSINTRLTNLRTLKLIEAPSSIFTRNPELTISRDKAWSKCKALQSLTTIYCYRAQCYMLRLLLPRVDIIAIEDHY